MARKRKELPELKDVTVSALAAEGKSIARVDDMVVFIPFGAPGDRLDVKLDKKKKSYAEGHITRIIAPSPMRVEPPCEHFTVCGGCKWQHIPYAEQLRAKQQVVTDALERIAKVPLPPISPIIGAEQIWEYRNKMEYTFSASRWLTFDQIRLGDIPEDRTGVGFHIPGAFDKVVDITRCHLQDDFGNRLRNRLRQIAREDGLSFYDLRAQQGLLRTLMVRLASTGEKMAVVVFGEAQPEAMARVLDRLREEFPELTSLMYCINTKVNDSLADREILLHSGKPYIEERMEDLRFRVSPKSFYQTNSAQALRLYTVARDFAALTGEELVYDLYTGTGTIANFVARHARRVIGIEYVEDAIADARLNAEVNGLDNTLFLAGDMKDVLTDAFIAEHGRPDVMIVDPPRAGMHEDVVKVILGAAPSRIVYVSCNPATQARDLALLHERYSVEAVQPVDMFPHTHHVENVVLLKLRG